MVHMGNVKLVTPLGGGICDHEAFMFINNLGRESLYKLIYQILDLWAVQLQIKEMRFFSSMSLCKTTEPQFRIIV